MKTIHHLLYSSVATSLVSKEAIHAILTVAKRDNKLLEISGLLLYRARHFIQLLEGEEFAVVALYEKIKLDPRHENLRLLTQFNSDTRIFGQWNMGYIQDPDRSDKIFKSLATVLEDTLDHSANVKAEVARLFRAVNQADIS